MQSFNPDLTEKIIDEIKKRTKTSAYSLTVENKSEISLFDSKFGGMPYWDLKKEYPSDSCGNKLMLLAQINFDNADVNSPLPQSGMLQFFIDANDDVYGADFDNPENQDKFRVVYHDKVDYSINKQKISELDIPVIEECEYSPISKELPVKICSCESYMDYNNSHFDDIIKDILNNMGESIPDEISLYQYIDDEYYDKIIEAVSACGHKMLGFPFFTQSDPREYSDTLAKYDTLLLQIDSEEDDDRSFEIIWGDCGVANFFINSEALLKKDFSKVIYNWDCY